MWELLMFAVGVACADSVSLDDRQYYNISIQRSARYTGEESKNVVVTEHGAVRGYESNGVIQFFDIPYGVVNTQNPFQGPSKAQSWEEIREKDEHASRCPQINSENSYIGSIECLTLSVFKPQNAESSSILFHIHDSNFSTGSGDPRVYVPKNFVAENLIVVLPNYRLGPLGFLCLRNLTAPGNAGLKDLTLALEWVYENIKNFGGDASNIVVSGSGAAGAIVEYLLLNNNSRKFISKAIVESGFTLSPWALDRHPLHTANMLAAKLSVEPSADSGNTYSSIQGADIEVLVKAAKDIYFRPCIESEVGFLIHSPWAILENETIELPYMLGSASQAAKNEIYQHTAESLSQINQNGSLLLPNDLAFVSNEERINVVNQIKSQYFGDENITMANVDRLSQCISDRDYIYPGIRVARLLVKGGATVFFYEYSYDTNNPNIGAGRGEFISLVFSEALPQSDARSLSYTENENSLTNKIVKLWVDFIKTGQPSAENIEWSKMKNTSDTEEEWLSIDKQIRLQKGFHTHRMKLWNDIYKNHFVERNIGLELKPSDHITLGSLILLVNVCITF